jgi:hypothetical protein
VEQPQQQREQQVVQKLVQPQQQVAQQVVRQQQQLEHQLVQPQQQQQQPRLEEPRQARAQAFHCFPPWKRRCVVAGCRCWSLMASSRTERQGWTAQIPPPQP